MFSSSFSSDLKTHPRPTSFVTASPSPVASPSPSSASTSDPRLRCLDSSLLPPLPLNATQTRAIHLACRLVPLRPGSSSLRLPTAPSCALGAPVLQNLVGLSSLPSSDPTGIHLRFRTHANSTPYSVQGGDVRMVPAVFSPELIVTSRKNGCVDSVCGREHRFLAMGI